MKKVLGFIIALSAAHVIAEEKDALFALGRSSKIDWDDTTIDDVDNEARDSARAKKGPSIDVSSDTEDVPLRAYPETDKNKII